MITDPRTQIPVSQRNHTNYRYAQTHDPNGKTARQVRDGPIDLWMWNLHYRSNPDMMGAEDFRPVPRSSFVELQNAYANKLTVNPVIMQSQLWGGNKISRTFFDRDVTHEKIPTMTMGSGWLKEMLEKSYAQTGVPRPMFNAHRTYGS